MGTDPDMGATMTTETGTPDMGTQADENDGNAEGTPPEGTEVDHKAEADKWRAQARKHESGYKRLEKELEELQRDRMSDTDRKVAEARDEGIREGVKSAAGKIAAAELRVAATGRLDDGQITTLLESVDVSRFLDHDGDVDTDKVRTFVDGIAPKPTGNGTPDLGQGKRHAPASTTDPLQDALQRAVGTR